MSRNLFAQFMQLKNKACRGQYKPIINIIITLYWIIITLVLHFIENSDNMEFGLKTDNTWNVNIMGFG